LSYLKQTGLADRILQLAAMGKTEIVGICGGFQMIGRDIEDPDCVETASGRAGGLGLLDIRTVMKGEKTLLRVTARHAPSGLTVHGYEIHHGQTQSTTPSPLFIRADGESIGMANTDDRIWGTYLHGVFDANDFRRWFINRLRTRRGLAPMEGTYTAYDIEPALNELAGVVRKAIHMDEVYRLIGLRQ
jgi:cobyric acid synthase